MNEGLIEKGGQAFVLLEMRRDIAVGDLRGFAHHFTELAGELEATVFAVHQRGFDAEGGATHRCPRQASDNPHTAQQLLLVEDWFAQIGFKIIGADPNRSRVASHDLDNRLAYDPSQLFFQTAYTRFAGITFDYLAQSAIANFQF